MEQRRLIALIRKNINRQEGNSYSRPFAVISPDELAVAQDVDYTDSDDDGVVDLFDKWPDNPEYASDIDGDGIADEWEDQNGLDPFNATDAGSDHNSDGVTNLKEFENSLLPQPETPAAVTITGVAGDQQISVSWNNQPAGTKVNLCVATEAISDPYNCMTANNTTTRNISDVSSPYVVSGLTNQQTYYISALAEPASGSPYVSNALVLTPTQTVSGKLNDTGITSCANDTDHILPCPVEGFPGQDAESGRDVTANDDSDGHAGFSFTKLDSNGQPLPASANEWSCVKDNVTGLIWEIHTNDGGLRDKDNTYSWYNSDATTNGGYAGTKNDGQCSGGISCDTEGYVTAINTTGLCGYRDWRLPTVTEQQGLVDYSIPQPGPTIDSNFFPDTQPKAYWCSFSVADVSNMARIVNFSNGHAGWDDAQYKYRKNGIRLVRGGF